MAHNIFFVKYPYGQVSIPQLIELGATYVEHPQLIICSPRLKAIFQSTATYQSNPALLGSRTMYGNIEIVGWISLEENEVVIFGSNGNGIIVKGFDPKKIGED